MLLQFYISPHNSHVRDINFHTYLSTMLRSHALEKIFVLRFASDG
jgi:hypothetical protein